MCGFTILERIWTLALTKGKPSEWAAESSIFAGQLWDLVMDAWVVVRSSLLTRRVRIFKPCVQSAEHLNMGEINLLPRAHPGRLSSLLILYIVLVVVCVVNVFCLTS
jgi:hypothetical protein